MASPPLALLLSAWTTEGPYLKGGAERAGASTARALKQVGFDVVSISSGAWNGRTPRPPLRQQFSDESGHMVETIERAALVVALDRYPGELPRTCPSILQLSNLAYENERSAANPEWWSAAWVPSTHLRDALVFSFGWAPDRVRVIPPVLELAALDRDPGDGLRAVLSAAACDVPRSRLLLFPHRSDKGKGLYSVLALLERLLSRDRNWRLLVSGPSGEESDEEEILVQIRHDTDLHQHIRLLPWWPAPSMAFLYRAAGCTVMASQLDEGFGLVPYESVLAGTPVVARSTGALTYDQATRYGFHLVEDVASDRCVEVIEAAAGLAMPTQYRRAIAGSFSNDRYISLVGDSLRSLQ